MQIWVDADACPKVIKEILYRAVERVKIPMTLVANQPLWIPTSEFIKTLLVKPGLDVADDEIVEQINAGDLVITADIPLAAAVVEKGATALNPRGQLYTPENIKQRLSMRNFMDELRGMGIETGGPAAIHKGDHQAFANQLDRILTKALKNRK